METWNTFVEWWFSLPHSGIDAALSALQMVICLVYIVYAFVGLNTPKRPDGTPDTSKFYSRNRNMMIFVAAIIGTNLLRVPFSLSEGKSIWVGLLPLFLSAIWGMALSSLWLSRRNMRRLDVQLADLRESMERLNRVENHSYSGKMKDVWPPNPE